MRFFTNSSFPIVDSMGMTEQLGPMPNILRSSTLQEDNGRWWRGKKISPPSHSSQPYHIRPRHFRPCWSPSPSPLRCTYPPFSITTSTLTPYNTPYPSYLHVISPLILFFFVIDDILSPTVVSSYGGGISISGIGDIVSIHIFRFITYPSSFLTS